MSDNSNVAPSAAAAAANAFSSLKKFDEDNIENLETAIEEPSWWQPCSERAISCSSLASIDSLASVYTAKLPQSCMTSSTSINPVDSSELFTDFSFSDDDTSYNPDAPEAENSDTSVSYLTTDDSSLESETFSSDDDTTSDCSTSLATDSIIEP